MAVGWRYLMRSALQLLCPIGRVLVGALSLLRLDLPCVDFSTVHRAAHGLVGPLRG